MASNDDGARPEKTLHAAHREPITGARVGRLMGVNPEGLALVDFAGNPTSLPVAARSFVALGAEQLRSAVEERRDVVLLFEDGDPARPLLIALAQAPSAPSLLEQLLEVTSRPEAPEAKDTPKEDRLVLGAEKEIVLRVGEASITLRRDGTILLRGVRVESRASGLQLIRGGKIELN
ncbi:DUF6484 domain-containing protein [Myxococcus sp. SDU36]|uniref:DUF6484 domain-containing protein n=1 Tax=Myxococcus sp. SDU36 TaxID=2831967 RepID=UPI002542D279|nr:DUF6484 domain-containing protein [Myxococcus sp. SDU36]WIG93265.1 hypothetical protein KGD87_21980 [Myxococcus sp. SDU36]